MQLFGIFQSKLTHLMDLDLVGHEEEEVKGVNQQPDSGEKLNKCNQCDFASSSASYLRKHLKIHKSHTDANNVILHFLEQTI